MKHQRSKDNLGPVLREVLKTVRFQKRQLFFWIFLGLFTAGLLFIAQNAGMLFASTDIIENVDTTTSIYAIDVTINDTGKAVVNDKANYTLFRPLGNVDELHYKVFDKPKTFLDQVIVRVHFSQPLPPGVHLRSYAIHGIESASERQVDDRTLEYLVTGIGPEGSYTITATIPKGVVEWPWWRQLAAVLIDLPEVAWIATGLILPLIAILTLLIMFSGHLRHAAAGSPIAESDKLPDNLPPALVGIIVNGKITSREIAATLLDLANRGYITIFNRGDGEFSFAKRRAWQGLQSFELTLLSQLFSSSSYKSSRQEVEIAVGAQLFSPQITRVYLAMYDAATQAGYFDHNPAAVHMRYRFAGLILFFLGLLSFSSVLLFEIKPTALIFLFAGVMTMALVIIFAADSIPLRTAKGEATRLRWLTFKNYLKSPQPLGYIEGVQDYYEKYLPYAVVLKTEIDWAHRFQHFPFKVPDWYGSTEQSIAIEDFANGLYEIVGSMSELFSASKEPTVR